MDKGEIINKISIRLRRRSGKTGRRLGITEVQGRILEFILVESRDRQLFQKDIEREFDLRPSTATELLKNLEDQGMIQRVSSQRDGRYKIIRFTEAAEGIRLILQEELQKTEEQLIKDIPQKDLDAFMRVAGRMLENLSGIEGGCDGGK
ncbi:MAG: MarR family transcriptional regulator [Clostridium sp.]|nr:MarR family transcriptional regulator [Clostridium sp.]